MDELWQEFCNGIANALGGLVVRSLFTKGGLIGIYVLGLGILLVNYYWDVSPAESQARSIVKAQCRRAWSFYGRNGRMYSTDIALGDNYTYNFRVVPIGSNVSIITAQSIKSDFSNFVGIGMAFSPETNHGYSCVICKSNSSSNRNRSPVLTSTGLGCPNGYREVERIKP
jgi:hypothetical protein